MNKLTILHDEHVQADAKMTGFAGWQMPLHYGSQIQEHLAVRRSAGLFDVSHMGVLEIGGAQADDLLRRLLCNDVSRLTQQGQALYSPMLNADGGILDDLIVYKQADGYRLIINAARVDADCTWIEQQSHAYDVSLALRNDMSILALQGPLSAEILNRAYPQFEASVSALKRFSLVQLEAFDLARTGYTGEEGFELLVPNDQAVQVWRDLVAAGADRCGLAARDTLRLEAGYPLYGQDLSDQWTPLESNLGWTVAWEPSDRRFLGRDALERQRGAGVDYKLVGLVLDDRGIMRQGAQVTLDSQVVGEVTSGGFSPSLKKSIALARVPVSVSKDICVTLRGKSLAVRMEAPAFVRFGQPLI